MEQKMYSLKIGLIIHSYVDYQLKFLKCIVLDHILHVHSKEMEQQSTIVSMPIINANKSKYEDCVSIL